jgi:DNA-binding response OmpR family regulator
VARAAQAQRWAAHESLKSYEVKANEMNLFMRLRLLFARDSIDDITGQLPMAELKKRVKIVVIDDEQSSFPTRGLQEDGYTLEWWDRIDVGRLHRLENGDFDVIVLDIQGIVEPNLSDTGDGFGVLRRLKNVNPDQIVVAFSGNMYDLSSVAFFSRADDVLRKPVTLIQCKELIDRLISNHVSARAYWENLRRLLERQSIPPQRIRALEKTVSAAAKRGQTLSLEQICDVVGTKVYPIVQTIFRPE